ncbi:hypothetical protein CRENBAI_018896, partial [Crenichthys baileyi]
MEREFKRGEVLVELFTHLATSPSSPWRRLEIAGILQDWLKVRKAYFGAERQRALGEIAASMRRPPAPSSARLSTEAGGGFPAPDQPSPLLPTPNPFPGPVPEGFMDEPPPHPAPFPGPVPGGFIDELPPHPNPVSSSVLEGSQAEASSHSVPVREGFVDGLPPLAAPVPSPVLEGSEDELPPSLVPVPEEFIEDLSPLPVPVPEECEGASSLHAVPRRLRRRSPRPHRSGFRTAPLSSTVGFPGPAASLLIACPYVADLLIAGSARDGLQAGHLNSGCTGAGLRIHRLNSGSAWDSIRAGRLNSGSVGDGVRAVHLNSCPPSEAPSAHS